LPALGAAIIDEPDARAFNHNDILPILPKNNKFTLAGPTLYRFGCCSYHAVEGSLKTLWGQGSGSSCSGLELCIHRLSES
jgi:hypothetical protein